MPKALSEKQVAKIAAEGIKREGKHLILPGEPVPGMSLPEAIRVLQEKHNQESMVVSAHEIIDGNPFDALAAFHETLKQEYGWSTTHPTPSFFGDRPPVMVDVRTGHRPEDVIQVPIGLISAPGLDFKFNVQFSHDGLHLFADLKKYQAEVVKDLASKTRAWLKDHSIYKGKAFMVPNDWSQQPKFVDYSHADEDKLVLNQDISDAVLVNLFGAVKRREALKQVGVSFNSVALLEGGYGTGKSMTISCLSKIALENGVTVIHVQPQNIGRLSEVIQNAKRVMPAVVIAEDIDKIASSRTNKLEPILDTISGALTSENDDIMVVLTTNHAEKIERVMLRRVNIIQFNLPTKDTVRRLIRLYGRGRLENDGSLEEISQMLTGQSPTTIKRVMDNAIKAQVVLRLNSINEEVLIKTVHSMGRQIELLNTAKVEDAPVFDSVLRQIVREMAYKASTEAFVDALKAKGSDDYAQAVTEYVEKKLASE